MFYFLPDQVIDFNPDELSLLILTNDDFSNVDNYFEESNKQILTTKETYLWGIIISRIVQEFPEISSEEIINAYKKSIQTEREHLKNYYEELASDPFRDRHNEIAKNIIQNFQKELGIQLSLDGVVESERKAFRNLVESDYIKDPIFTTVGGLSVAVLGLFPYGFTKKTKKGRTVYKKIEAMFWLYEMRVDDSEKSTTRLKFRLWTVLKKFKNALAESTDEELGE